MESLLRRRRMYRCDIETAYESLFLRAMVGFEQYCELLFFGIVHRDIRYAAAEVQPQIRKVATNAFRGIVLQNKKYLDWIPYDNTVNRASLYLLDGKPFTGLDGNEIAKIKKMHLIRNAIAHVSDHSQREFQRQVIGNQSLLKREKTPAGFLRSQVTNSPPQCRFELYLAELGFFATKICGNPRWCKRTP